MVPLTLTDWDGYSVADKECWGDDGYDEIDAEVQVKVTDGRGNLVAIGALAAGKAEAVGCVFSFKVESPCDLDFPTNRISHRGELSYTNDEMRFNGESASPRVSAWGRRRSAANSGPGAISANPIIEATSRWL